MFDKEYSFKGKHAEYVNKLTSKFDKENTLFPRNFDVYLISPIIGFLYNRKPDLDKGTETTKIFADILIREQNNLRFNYNLIMLLDINNEPVLNERVDKAFRYYGTEKAKNNEMLYEAYARGGIEVLYEKLIENSSNSDDYLINLYNFLEEFEERYNNLITIDSIKDLCRLAKN